MSNEADERAHYAEGVAGLAMKHRDEAEGKLEYALGALRTVVAACDDTQAHYTIRALAQAGIDLATLGEDACAEMRGAFREGMASIEEITNLALSSDGEKGKR